MPKYFNTEEERKEIYAQKRLRDYHAYRNSKNKWMELREKYKAMQLPGKTVLESIIEIRWFDAVAEDRKNMSTIEFNSAYSTCGITAQKFFWKKRIPYVQTLNPTEEEIEKVINELSVNFFEKKYSKLNEWEKKVFLEHWFKFLSSEYDVLTISEFQEKYPLRYDSMVNLFWNKIKTSPQIYTDTARISFLKKQWEYNAKANTEYFKRQQLENSFFSKMHTSIITFPFVRGT